MTKFVLIPDSFSGNITFYFDGKGYLIEFQVNSRDITQDQHAGMLKHLAHCLTDAQFVDWYKARKYKVRREIIDLSFDRFMNFYGIARDRHKAEPLWNKYNDKDKFYILLNVKAYKRWCKRNPTYIQMYPAAYLRAHTKDDWDKVPDFK